MVYFCQPDGCLWTYRKRPAAREKTSFVFTLTDKDSAITRFGVCLNFYRGVARRTGQSESSGESRRRGWKHGTDQSYDSAFFSDSKNQSSTTVGGPSDSDRDDRPSTTTTATTTTTADNSNERDKPGFESIFSAGSEPEQSPRSDRRKHGSKRNKSKLHESSNGGGPLRNQSLTSVCIVSSHPFFTNFRECLTTLKKLVDACSNSNGRWKVGGKTARSSDYVWSVLTGDSVDSASSFLLHDIREIETWILRLLSAPVPVSGQTRLELEIVDRRYGPLLLFAFPDPTRFSLCDFPIHLPLELLGVDLSVQVLTLIMLEKKVIIHSRDLNALSLSIMALTQLLYPLQYMFPMIPILPTSMPGSEQLLLAPTPYLIGLPSSFLKYNKLPQVPDDVWLIDLDAAVIKPPSNPNTDNTIPALPSPDGGLLRSQLKQVFISKT